MFHNLTPQLADKFRVIAPDYPGFGNCDEIARLMRKFMGKHAK